MPLHRVYLSLCGHVAPTWRARAPAASTAHGSPKVVVCAARESRAGLNNELGLARNFVSLRRPIPHCRPSATRTICIRTTFMAIGLMGASGRLRVGRGSTAGRLRVRCESWRARWRARSQLPVAAAASEGAPEVRGATLKAQVRARAGGRNERRGRRAIVGAIVMQLAPLASCQCARGAEWRHEQHTMGRAMMAADKWSRFER